jgi:hypothetical protein
VSGTLTMPVVGIAIDPYGGFRVYIGAEETWVATRAEANTALDEFESAWYAEHGHT